MNLKCLDAYDLLVCYNQSKNRLEYPDGQLKFLRTSDKCEFYYPDGKRAAELEYSKNNMISRPAYVLRAWTRDKNTAELKASGYIGREPSWYCLYNKETGNMQEFYAVNKMHFIYDRFGKIQKYLLFLNHEWTDLYPLCKQNNPDASCVFIRKVLVASMHQLRKNGELRFFPTDIDFSERRKFMLGQSYKRGFSR